MKRKYKWYNYKFIFRNRNNSLFTSALLAHSCGLQILWWPLCPMFPHVPWIKPSFTAGNLGNALTSWMGTSPSSTPPSPLSPEQMEKGMWMLVLLKCSFSSLQIQAWMCPRESEDVVWLQLLLTISWSTQQAACQPLCQLWAKGSTKAVGKHWVPITFIGEDPKVQGSLPPGWVLQVWSLSWAQMLGRGRGGFSQHPARAFLCSSSTLKTHGGRTVWSRWRLVGLSNPPDSGIKSYRALWSDPCFLLP